MLTVRGRQGFLKGSGKLIAKAKITPEREWLSVLLPGFRPSTVCYFMIAATSSACGGGRLLNAFLMALYLILPRQSSGVGIRTQEGLSPEFPSLHGFYSMDQI